MKKLNLTQAPTPLEHLQTLGQQLGIDLWIKRDDLTGDLLTGGNKSRKLEYIFSDALAKGADTVITAGGLQSNHAKITAALAIKLGLKPVLLLDGQAPKISTANLWLDELMGVTIKHIKAPTQAEMNEQLQQEAKRLWQAGKHPYVIAVGGSTGLGSQGYTDAYQEMDQQRQTLGLNFDWEFVTAGSGGTMAGLTVGHQKMQSQSELVGISAWLPQNEITSQIERCISEEYHLLAQPEPKQVDVKIDDRYIGDGYGIPTAQGLAAMKLLASTSAIIVDQLYTAKTLAALIDYVKAGKIKPGQSVLFWHTGGAAAVFGLKQK